MKIKICGLTNLDDALAATEMGADLLGFNFYPDSPRYITPEACARLLAALRLHGSSTPAVGVFVNADRSEVRRVVAACELDMVQLHGDEPPDFLAALGVPAFKAVRPRTTDEAQSARVRYAARATPPALLVDAFQPGLYGGTGAIGDWSAAAALAGQAPILLAGGLTPENVALAIAQVHPWGVDVASGVESSPGHKDQARMAAFVAAVRRGIEESPHACGNRSDGRHD